MALLSPAILELLEQVRQIALSYPEAEEYFPWGTRSYFRSLKGRNFLFVVEGLDDLVVSLRLPLGEQAGAVSLPFVERHKSMGFKDWFTATIKTDEELDLIKPWIGLSYELGKPFRGKADCLPGEQPYILEFLDRVRQIAHSYEDIEEYFPFGDRAFRKRKGQIFLHANEHQDGLYVAVRLPMGEREHALSLPFVEVPKYIGHKGWVGAKVRNEEELETVLPWVDLSYEMNQPVRKNKLKSKK